MAQVRRVTYSNRDRSPISGIEDLPKAEEVKRRSQDSLHCCRKIMFFREIIMDFPDGSFLKIKIRWPNDFAMREDSPYFFYPKEYER